MHVHSALGLTRGLTISSASLSKPTLNSAEAHAMKRGGLNTGSKGATKTGGPLLLNPSVGKSSAAFSATEAAKQQASQRPVFSATEQARLLFLGRGDAADRPALTGPQIKQIAAEVLAEGSTRPVAEIAPADDLTSVAPTPATTSAITDELVEKIIKTLDHDGDGHISIREAPFDDEVFGAFDSDNDGLISADELRAGLERELGRVQADRADFDAERFAMDLVFGGRQLQVSSPSAEKVAPTPAIAVDPTVPATQGLDPDARTELEGIAKRIGQRLEAAGFGDKPPVNVRALLAKLGLQGPSANYVMKLLHGQFPHVQGFGPK